MHVKLEVWHFMFGMIWNASADFGLQLASVPLALVAVADDSGSSKNNPKNQCRLDMCGHGHSLVHPAYKA
jgi:hypothetical protein